MFMFMLVGLSVCRELQKTQCVLIKIYAVISVESLNESELAGKNELLLCTHCLYSPAHDYFLQKHLLFLKWDEMIVYSMHTIPSLANEIVQHDPVSLSLSLNACIFIIFHRLYRISYNTYNISISSCEILTFPSSSSRPTRQLFFILLCHRNEKLLLMQFFPISPSHLVAHHHSTWIWLIDMWCNLHVNRARRHQSTSGTRTIQRTVARDMRDACQRFPLIRHSALHHWISPTYASPIRDGMSVRSCFWIDRPTSTRMERGIIWMFMHRRDSVSRRRI